MEASIPTIAEYIEKHLVSYFERPEVVEQTKQLRVTGDAFVKLCSHFGYALKRVADSPRSIGYEPWLIEHGSNPVAARGMAHLIVHRAKRLSRDSAKLSAVVRALQFLAKLRRNKPARSRRISFLLEAWEETSIIETIFNDAGLDDIEFVRQLRSAAEGDNYAYHRVTEIAANLAPHLPVSYGPKVAAPSVAHEVFLEEVVSRLDPSYYTWSIKGEDYSDSVTAATRREFEDNDFNPQPAARRVKARQRAGGSGKCVLKLYR